ncbi:1329_t:CDS:2, partial [Funneliformis geosporum]
NYKSLIPKISEKILSEVNASTTPMTAENVSAKRLNSNSSDDSSKIGLVAMSISFVSQVISSKKSRLPISILPEDPEEKRKYIIGLVLERFPSLSLRDSSEHYECDNSLSITSLVLTDIYQFVLIS